MVVIKTLEQVTGWLTDNEARWLNYFAAQIIQGCIVEIGSFQGKSTIAMALNAKVPVYAIDPHHDHTDEEGGQFGRHDVANFYINVMKANVEKKIYPIHLPSYEIAKCWKRPIGMIFIDGGHSYENVKRDVEDWLPHMIQGGVIALHDRTWPDIARLIQELNTDGRVTRWQTQDSIQAYQVA